MKKKLNNRYKKKTLTYKFIANCSKVYYKKNEYIGLENLPDEPCIITGNHSKLHGPINAELYFPTKKLIWCDEPMMNKKEFIGYAYKTFFNGKPNFFHKIGMHILAPIVANVMSSADSLPVYRDMRIMKTYKATTEAINNGLNVVILPECTEEYNEITNCFNEYFVDAARFYYKHYQKELLFVPMYYSVRLKKMVFGKPIRFDSKNSIDEERKRICAYLMDEITKIAKTLPRHVVVPFNNVDKSQYKYSK
ncbi:MAG: hypothetical protein E7348_05710 [Clostridiales bacterium]|nr:hypothetical protein [Clostridiales bacterium]